jgi:hypothetical protein
LWIRAIIEWTEEKDCWLQKGLAPGQQGGVKRLVMAISTGRLRKTPWPERVTLKMREILDAAVARCPQRASSVIPPRAVVTCQQKVEVRLLQRWLKACGDPDHKVMNSYAKGVRLGWKQRMPRTPAVYERQRAWRLPRDVDPSTQQWPKNYRSAMDLQEKFREHTEKEVRQGRVDRCTFGEAKARWPGRLEVAACGAVEQVSSADGEVDFRFTHDGTHGVHVNHYIRSRDKLRSPLGTDLRRVVQDVAEDPEPGVAFSLVFDIEKAHRVVPVHPDDQGLMAFTPEANPPVEDDDEVHYHKVGTYGIGSAAYHWGRLGACGSRAMHYVMGRHYAGWFLLYADDGNLIAKSRNWHLILLIGLAAWIVFGFPIKWAKAHGGFELDWIGYYLDLGRFRVGISPKRKQWLQDWIRDAEHRGALEKSEVSEVLGRFGFASRVIDELRPFLGPLYAWAASMNAQGRRRIPAMLRLILEHLHDMLERHSTVPCLVKRSCAGEVFRTDAKAEGDEVALGGWRCEGGVKPGEAEWFAIKITRDNAPWVWEKEGETKRVIAALEMLATLVALYLWGPTKGQQKETIFDTQIRLSAATDNRGNGYMIDKMMTTAYPSCCVLIQLADYCQREGLALSLDWVPRDDNVEADALTNMDLAMFDPLKERKVELGDLDMGLMDKLLIRGKELYKEVRELKDLRKNATEAILSGRRVKRRKKLRIRAPWNLNYRREESGESSDAYGRGK